jgi:sigma-B regulation protein RsbU (phosphoserine phosphatase)
VTLLFAQFDTERRRLQYTSAGHPTGYVIDSAGRVKWRLESTAVPLGVMPDTEFATQGPLPFEEGDTVLLLTDGVLEVPSPDGGLFGEERLLATVRDHCHLPAAEIISRLHQSLLDFAGDRQVSDDVTAVVVKVEANGQA